MGDSSPLDPFVRWFRHPEGSSELSQQPTVQLRQPPPQPSSADPNAPTELRAQTDDAAVRVGSSANKGTDASTRDVEVGTYSELFDRLDTNKNGEISLVELQIAMRGESELVLSRSHKLRVMREELENGKRSGLNRTEFAELMKELFWLTYTPFFRSTHIEERLTAKAWQHVLGTGGYSPLLREEAQNVHTFQSVKHKSREERVRIFRAVLSSVVDEAAEQMADAVVAAGEYEVQQGDSTHSGKFAGMVLGDPLCFDCGVEMLGLPDLAFEEAISREHASTENFNAWNNDEERVTSPAEQLQMVLPDGWDGPINNRDYRGNVMCEDFEKHPQAREAGLVKVELVMLRLYTGPMYVKYNGRLRNFLRVMQERLGRRKSAAAVKEALESARKELGNAYVTSIVVLVSAMQKLRIINPLPPGRTVYRGFHALTVPESFKREDARGNRGGVEFGFLSTSISKEQAIGYIDFSRGMPQLYEIEVGQIDRGADISWISYFPGEAEVQSLAGSLRVCGGEAEAGGGGGGVQVLMPPLCSLEAVGDPRIEDVQALRHAAAAPEPRKVMVWPIRINVNLKGKTIDEHRAQRKALHSQMADNALAEAAAVLAPALAAQSPAGADLAGLAGEVLKQCEAVVAGYRAKEEGHFNDDLRYSSAIQDVLLLKPWASALIDLHASLGIAVPELRALRIHDFLPSAEAADTGRTARGMAAGAVSRGRALFEGGIDDVDDEGLTALARSVRAADPDAVRLLLAAGAGTELLRQYYGHTVLFETCDTRAPGFRSDRTQMAAMARLLVEGGANVNFAMADGKTALAAAVNEARDEALVRALLQLKADPNPAWTCGDGVLFDAVSMSEAGIAQALVAAGASPHQADSRGYPVLFMALSIRGLSSVASALVDAGADVCKIHKDETSLMAACSQKGEESEAMALRLLDLGVSPTFQDQHNYSAFAAAIENGMERVVARLLEAEADPNGACPQGLTPLTLALTASPAQEGVARLLLAHGALPNAPAAIPDPRFPLDIAEQLDLHATAQLLRDQGAVGGGGGAEEG